MASTRIREGAVMERLERIVRGQSEANLKLATLVREGKKTASTPEIQTLADDLGSLIDDHFEDLVDTSHLDPFNRMIQVVDSRTGEASDLVANRLDNYFPHKLDPKWFGNWKGLRKELLGKGHDAMKVDRFIQRMQYRPKSVGHIELKRQADELDFYELDPRKALPAYFRDSIMRQELGKQFGIGHEILDNLVGDLKNQGLRTEWVDRLAGAVTGTERRYDEALQSFAGALNSVQAVTKLGVATSVANFSQSPLNHVIRNGFINYAKSLWNAGIPVPGSPKILGSQTEGIRRIGMAAYNRGMQEQIRRMVTGGTNTLWDRIGSSYMKGIGFNYTERVGRMVGAVGGKLEVEDLIKQWAKHNSLGDVGKAKRVVHELQRKYNIDGDMLRRLQLDEKGATIFADELEGIVERGALKASDAIMHAFDVMDLPLGWRDPLWRSILQFKSFGYKQMEFMGKEVMQPALQYYASGGTKGTIAPLLRSAAMYPPMAMGVDAARDAVKNVPDYLLWGEWDLKNSYFDDPHPGLRLWNDMMYVGSLGLMGDAIEQAERGKLSAWMLGPTAGEAVRLAEETAQGRLKPGKVATRFLPGTLSLNRGRSILNQAKGQEDLPFEWMFR